MNQDQQVHRIENDEITLKDLILKFKEYVLQIFRSWWIVGIFILIMAFIMYLRARLSETSYIAQVTFMVSGGGGSENVNPLSGLLGQVGIGGGSGAGDTNPIKVIQLSQSLKIMGRILFSDVEVMGKKDYVANHLIEYYDYKEKWDDEKLKDFSFQHPKIDSFNRLENRVLKQLHFRLRGTGSEPALIALSCDEDSGIYTMTANTLAEDLSIQIAKKAYETLSSYYTARRIEPQKKRYDAIKTRLDSVSKVLKNLDYRVARSQDQSFGLPDRTSNIEGERLQREQQIAILTYGEIRKNLEVADYALRSSKPFFQVVDDAMSPAQRVKPSTTTAIILGIILGAFLGILFVVLRKLVMDALNS
ncbi:MAG: GNVR domain-containing protein [Bacteroidota bacterium]